MAYLTDIERSPNTVKAYAHDLKDYWIFLRHRGLDWREVRLEDIGEYVAWLRLPPTGRDGHVAVLPSVQPHVAASTINGSSRRCRRSMRTKCDMVSMSASC
jgi:integrase/recombinase XerD